MAALEKKPAETTRHLTVWRLRFKKGVNSASRVILEPMSERLADAELFFAGVVVFGIVLELAIAFAHPSYETRLARFGPIVADALIALGLVFEILTSSRLRIIEGELRSRLEVRLRQAYQWAAEANVRADKAEGRLDDAERDLDSAWRTAHSAQEQADSAEARLRDAESALDSLWREAEAAREKAAWDADWNKGRE
ncbi:MAG TPA: hypothetical protein VIM02_05265 [Rhizomicrobium sp.]|jgi:hypothetical protein